MPWSFTSCSGEGHLIWILNLFLPTFYCYQQWYSYTFYLFIGSELLIEKKNCLLYRVRVLLFWCRSLRGGHRKEFQQSGVENGVSMFTAICQMDLFGYNVNRKRGHACNSPKINTQDRKDVNKNGKFDVFAWTLYG